MKVFPTKAQLVFVSLSTALLLTACATPTSREATEPASLAAQYMYQTERNAQERMVTVYWVNPPSSASLAKTDDDDR